MKYAIYKNPSNQYEPSVERISLQEKVTNPFIAKANLIKKANYMNSNQEKLKGYLTLWQGEKCLWGKVIY